MKLLIGIAAGLIATGALAQSTTTTTSQSTTTKPPAEMNRSTGSVVHNSTTTSSTVRKTGSVTHTATRAPHRTNRKCYTQMRNGKKVRVCRTRHNSL